MSQNMMEVIEAQIAAKHLLTHPFYQAWQRGELTREILADYAQAYYPHVAAFPTYLSALHSHTSDAETRRALLQNLIDEEAGTPNHPELWLQFAEGVGADRNTVQTAEPTQEAKELIAAFTDICRNGSVAAGIAALYAYESQIPEIAGTKIDGLVNFYGIKDDQTLSYFRVHQEADVAHSADERDLLATHLEDADAADATVASQRVVNGLWNLVSGVCVKNGIEIAEC